MHTCLLNWLCRLSLTFWFTYHPNTLSNLRHFYLAQGYCKCSGRTFDFVCLHYIRAKIFFALKRTINNSERNSMDLNLNLYVAQIETIAKELLGNTWQTFDLAQCTYEKLGNCRSMRTFTFWCPIASHGVKQFNNTTKTKFFDPNLNLRWTCLCCFYFSKTYIFLSWILGTGHPLNFRFSSQWKNSFLRFNGHSCWDPNTGTHATSPQGVRHALALIIPKWLKRK